MKLSCCETSLGKDRSNGLSYISGLITQVHLKGTLVMGWNCWSLLLVLCLQHLCTQILVEKKSQSHSDENMKKYNFSYFNVTDWNFYLIKHFFQLYWNNKICTYLGYTVWWFNTHIHCEWLPQINTLSKSRNCEV